MAIPRLPISISHQSSLPNFVPNAARRFRATAWKPIGWLCPPAVSTATSRCGLTPTSTSPAAQTGTTIWRRFPSWTEGPADDTKAPRLLGTGRDAEPAGQTLLANALVELHARDADHHEARLRELGYLANVLVAGVGAGGAPLRPLDAAEAALATCNLGLEHALAAHAGGGRAPDATAYLERLSCDVLFRVGWRLLHDALAQPAAAAVERVATRLAQTTETSDGFFPVVLGQFHVPRFTIPVRPPRGMRDH